MKKLVARFFDGSAFGFLIIAVGLLPAIYFAVKDVPFAALSSSQPVVVRHYDPEYGVACYGWKTPNGGVSSISCVVVGAKEQ